MKPSKQEINQATVYWILIGMIITSLITGIDWLGIIGFLGILGFTALLNAD